ncbi:MAG: nitroreductase family protein [Actinomycetota bacterium]|nr:nitroreductase family protein [Actinomycetota bacterium]
MEFADVIRKRRMARRFEPTPLAPGVADRLLSAGLRGPTAGFTQAVDLLALEGGNQTGRYWDAALPAPARAGFAWPGLLRAPLLVVVLSSEDAYRRRYAEPDKAGAARDDRSPDDEDDEVPWWHVDAAFAALLLLLAAIDEGLDALFFRAHRPTALRAALGIPSTYAPVGTVAIGHAEPDRASSSVATRTRRPAAARVHRGRW